MIFISEVEDCTLTVGKIRELIKDLPDSTIVVCEDGGWQQALADGAKVCRNVMVGESVNRTFVADEELEEARREESENIILRLGEAVLCIETCGTYEEVQREPRMPLTGEVP